MTRQWLSMALLAGLVATPVSGGHAQSNPWYIPPQQPVQPAQPQAAAPQTYGQAAPQLVPQGYVQVPQYGFSAGYVGQLQSPGTVLVPVPAQPSQIPYGHVQQPTTTGAVGGSTSVTGGHVYAAPAPSTGYPQAYQAQPTYQRPATQYVPQQQVSPGYAMPSQEAPQYQTYQQLQVLGSYPPLGHDPTKPAAPHQQAQSTARAPPASAPASSLPGAWQQPGFAGPTTLTPGFGYPGLTPTYPAPLGASPYLGLPFY
jgi:hypothetical protein